MSDFSILQQLDEYLDSYQAHNYNPPEVIFLTKEEIQAFRQECETMVSYNQPLFASGWGNGGMQQYQYSGIPIQLSTISSLRPFFSEEEQDSLFEEYERINERF